MKTLRFLLAGFVLFSSAQCLADTWADLGAVASLPGTFGGSISESCQYRIRSAYSRINLAGQPRPGAIYFGLVSKEQTSINFGRSMLAEPADYQLVDDLRQIGAFQSAKKGDAALSVLRSAKNLILSARLVVMQTWSLSSGGLGSLYLELRYIPAGKKATRTVYALNGTQFNLEEHCPGT